MGVYDLHIGKRTVIIDEKIDNGKGKVLCMILAKSLEPGKYESVVHIQKGSEDKSGYVEPIRGGIMIDTKLLPDVKRVIDKIYMTAINEGLIDPES